MSLFSAGPLCGHKTVGAARRIFFIDFGRDKACNLHVAQRPLTKGVLFAFPATLIRVYTRVRDTWKIRLQVDKYMTGP
jgi:hypothetical protein